MRVLLGLLAALMLDTGTAAAFECTGVTLPSSLVICSDQELMRLADERQAAINEVRARLDANRWRTLWEDQKAWVRSYSTRCGVPPDRPPPIPVPAGVKECFREAAATRLAFIRQYSRTDAATPSLQQEGSKTSQSLQLSGDQRWVVLASRKEVDEAIGIARYFSGAFPSARVVKTTAGIYAVIVGPTNTGSIEGFKEQAKNGFPLPKDAFLSNGEHWTDEIWRFRSPILAEVQYDGKHPTALNYGTITLSISRASVTTDQRTAFVPLLTVQIGDKVVGTIKGTSDVASDEPHTHVFLVRLDRDRDTPMPQIVMTAFTGGAHCCTTTQIATSDRDGRWSVLTVDTLDGDGYGFEDIGGDGVSELVSVDNSFLYAFDAYAYSYSPIRIQRLEGTKILDVRQSYERYLRQDLNRMEFAAEQTPELWHSNGFLGGWVAAKSLVGELDDAWPRMLASYNKSSDWFLEECTNGLPLDKCPASFKKRLSFPEALQRHLIEHGYTGGTKTSRAVVNTAPPEVPKLSPPPSPTRDTPDSPALTAISGSGYVISQDGYLITNAHVVGSCRTVTVAIGPDRAQGRVVARDTTNDLALVKTELKSKSVALLRTGVRLGESVAVYGFPLHGLLATSGNFTIGNVTAVAGIRDDTRMLQISAPVQPGNSGGPLLDQAGNVVGTIVAKIDAIKLALITNDLAENINFAIKSSVVTAFLEANGVGFSVAPAGGVPLSPPDIADRARQFSVSIECRL